MLISVQDIMDYLQETEHKVLPEGDKNIEIRNFCSLSSPQSEAITWIKNAEENSLSKFSGCGNCIVVAKKAIPNSIANCCFLITEEPKAVFFSILNRFWGATARTGIAASAVVESDRLAPDVSVGHHCYIGKDVSVGAGTVIEHNVSIYNKVVIGENCLIHSGTVIGTDGYGYFMDGGKRPVKVRHYGGVKIGDDVEIGANTAICRGTMDDTVIGNHTKIDNLCHIAHNCQIGENVLLVANTILCGSVKVENGAYVAPGGIVKNQLTLHENAFVGIGGVVLKDVDPDTVAAGVPARAMRKVTEKDK